MKKTKGENIMENKIIRECVQGLIDDSKMIDDLCEKLDCHRTEILAKIEDSFALESEPIATIDQIKEVISSVKSARSYINDARYSAEEASSQTSNAIRECEDAETYIDDALNVTERWEIAIKQIAEPKEETTEETTEETNN
jgi:hypothetical protein